MPLGKGKNWRRKKQHEDEADLHSGDKEKIQKLYWRVNWRIGVLEKNPPDADSPKWAAWKAELSKEMALRAQTSVHFEPQRPRNFVGLTVEEQRLFHSANLKERKLLRDRLQERIKVMSKDSVGAARTRLLTDHAWKAAVSSLTPTGANSNELADKVPTVLAQVANLPLAEAMIAISQLLGSKRHLAQTRRNISSRLSDSTSSSEQPSRLLAATTTARPAMPPALLSTSDDMPARDFWQAGRPRFPATEPPFENFHISFDWEV